MARITLMLALMFFGALASHSQEVRIVVIDGVEYRALSAEEMRRISTIIDEHKVQKVRIDKLEETVKLYDELIVGKDKLLQETSEKLITERNFWQEQYNKEKIQTEKYSQLFRSCTGKILGVFRICRL